MQRFLLVAIVLHLVFTPSHVSAERLDLSICVCRHLVCKSCNKPCDTGLIFTAAATALQHRRTLKFGHADALRLQKFFPKKKKGTRSVLLSILGILFLSPLLCTFTSKFVREDCHQRFSNCVSCVSRSTVEELKKSLSYPRRQYLLHFQSRPNIP